MASTQKFLVISIVVMFILSVGQARNMLEDQTMSMQLRYRKWMAEQGRAFLNDLVEEERFEIFKKNAEFIDKANSEDKPYKVALNEWADLTNEEFKTRLGYKPYNASKRAAGLPFINTMQSDDLQAVPPRLDWREKGVVTPVRAQGECGCCRAFSTVAAVESITKIKKGQLLNLSEQQLVDCDRKFNNGCRGGSMVSAFDYIHHHGGLASRYQYPYKGFNNGTSCNNNIASQVQAKLSGFGLVPPNNENELLKAVAHQPVSVAVDSTCDAFRFYSSGILTQHCGTKLDHAVTIIGYGEENGMKYWLAKNSWGTNWGENGFIRMRRESGIPAGMCGLALDASYPVV